MAKKTSKKATKKARKKVTKKATKKATKKVAKKVTKKTTSISFKKMDRSPRTPRKDISNYEKNHGADFVLLSKKSGLYVPRELKLELEKAKKLNVNDAAKFLGKLVRKAKNIVHLEPIIRFAMEHWPD